MSEIKTICAWSETARMCFKRDCVCKGCYYEKFFTDSAQKCQMKHSVKETLKLLGKPKPRKVNLLSETEIFSCLQ